MSKCTIISLLALLLTLPALAQKYPERRLVREGNRHYEREAYPEGEIAYRRALEKGPASYEAARNLGKSLYKQERWDEAAQFFGPSAADSLHRNGAASAWYDLGNALFQQRKLQEALEAYKQSLRLDPTDRQAKFNLAYVQKLLENEQQKNDDPSGGGGGQDNQPQPQPQSGEGEGQPQDNQGDKPDPQQGDGQGGMSRQEAEQMLEAMQMSEDRTRERKEGEKTPAVRQRGEKNW